MRGAKAEAPSEEDDAYVDPFGNPVRPMAPPTDPDPDYADDYDKDDKKDKDDKDDDEDHHHHKESDDKDSDDKDSDDADKQSDDDDDEGPTPDPVMPWGFDDDKDDEDHHHHKHDAALGAAPEQPAADGEDVQGRSEASLGARDPMALLAEARREADAARAAKMRAIEGMMRRTSSSSGGGYGVKAASAAAALGVAPEDRDREDAEDAEDATASSTGIASLGALSVTADERVSGMGRAKAAVGVGVVVAAVAAFGVVATVGAVTRLAAPGAGDRGSDAERIPLVMQGRRGGSRGGDAVDDAQLAAASDSEHSWQRRAATRWGTRRANGDAGDDWADVV